MVAKRLILPISKTFPAFVRCPVSGVIRVVTKKSIIIRLPDDTCFLIIVKSFREVCIFDRNVKSFHNSPYLLHNP